VKGPIKDEVERGSLFGIDSRELCVKGHSLDRREGSIFSATDEDTSGNVLVFGLPLTDNAGKRHSATLAPSVSRGSTEEQKKTATNAIWQTNDGTLCSALVNMVARTRSVHAN